MNLIEFLLLNFVSIFFINIILVYTALFLYDFYFVTKNTKVSWVQKLRKRSVAFAEAVANFSPEAIFFSGAFSVSVLFCSLFSLI